MKKPLAILLIFFHILPSIPFAQQAQSIAVIEFEAKGISQIEASALSDELEINLTDIGGYTVVERGRVGEILNEQAFQQTGCVSSECAVEIGKLLSVQNIVLGSISKVGRTFSVNAKIVDVKSGEILRTANYKHRGLIDDLLTEGMAEVVTQLTGKSINKVPVVTKPSSTTQPKTQPSVPSTRTERPRSVKYGPGTGSVIFNFNTDYLSSWSKSTLRFSKWDLIIFTTDGYNTEVYNSTIELNIDNPDIAHSVTLPSGRYRLYPSSPMGYDASPYLPQNSREQAIFNIRAGETQNITLYIYRDNSEGFNNVESFYFYCGSFILLIAFLLYGNKHWSGTG